MFIAWTGASAQDLKTIVGPVIAQYAVTHRVCSEMESFPECLPGDVVLAYGSRALAVLVSLGLVPKNRTAGSMREKELTYNGVSVFLTYDPGICSRDYARLPEIQWDTQLAIRKCLTGSVKPKVGTYRYVDSLHELIDTIEAKYASTGRAVDMSCDLETKSLNPYNPAAWIISASFTIEEGKSDVLYFERMEAPTRPLPWVAEEEMSYWEGLWTQINWLLTSDRVSLRGANFKYDSNWIFLKWGILCSNQKFDTMLVGSLLDENRSNSLKLHAKIMTPMGGYEDDMDKYDFSCLEIVPKPEMLQYVGGDTDATYRVAIKMKAELVKDRALTNLYVKLIQPAAKAFEKMERNGVLVDRPYYDQLKVELETEITRLQHQMMSCLPNKMRIKYRDDFATSLADGKSPFKPRILKEFLFTPAGLNLKPKVFTGKTGEPSTAMDHLMLFGDDPVAQTFIAYFKELGSAQKTLSTYVVGFLKHLRQDGRFHATYMLHRGDYGSSDSGTTTGRTSAKDPAVQTVPKHSKWAKRLRKAYVSPPGKRIIQCDFSQGELRICAVVADEPVMLQAYSENQDLHAITAAKLNGLDFEDFLLLPEEERDAMRSGGKAGNFGLLYGMQHKGFREYAYTTYGVDMTEDEAFIARNAFFSLYSRLPEWHDTYKQRAKMWGYVRSPLGRVRHLPLINSRDREVVAQCERQAINSPIQSTLSDMMQLAMVHIDREYGDAVEMFMMTHDSLALYVPEDDAPLWAKRVKDVMENLPLLADFGWDSPLKFIADAEAGANLADLKKLKNL